MREDEDDDHNHDHDHDPDPDCDHHKDHDHDYNYPLLLVRRILAILRLLLLPQLLYCYYCHGYHTHHDDDYYCCYCWLSNLHEHAGLEIPKLCGCQTLSPKTKCSLRTMHPTKNMMLVEKPQTLKGDGGRKNPKPFKKVSLEKTEAGKP